ncbi:MAG: Uma2 family endonuclease [Caldilineaceae bacterium]
MQKMIEAVAPIQEQTPAWKATPVQCVLLNGVSWETYQRLLTEHEGNSSTHFAYNQGQLEIMVLSAKHERRSRALALLVTILAEESAMNAINFGSTTFRREDLERGFEPDSCFYIQNEELVRDKLEIDLAVDPAPDLVIEVDITSPSLKKFPIFAALGIAEVWRYDGERVSIWRLSGDSYRETTHSRQIPIASGPHLTEFLEAEPGTPRLVWTQRVRSWAQTQLSAKER